MMKPHITDRHSVLESHDSCNVDGSLFVPIAGTKISNYIPILVGTVGKKYVVEACYLVQAYSFETIQDGLSNVVHFRIDLNKPFKRTTILKN
jgi:hypothetical protein